MKSGKRLALAAATLAAGLAGQALGAAEADFYCAWHEAVGGMLKVDVQNGLVCKNGGPPRADFCTDQWTEALPLVRKSRGTIELGGQSFGFTEVVARSEFLNHKYMVIRIYDHVVARDEYPGAVYTRHHADYLGDLAEADVTEDPTAAFADGAPVCSFKE